MPDDKRERYLRKQRERRQRKTAPSALPTWAPPGQAAEASCDTCGLRFRVDLPVMGAGLRITTLDPDGVEREHMFPAEQTAWFEPCPRCGEGARIVNAHVHQDSQGVGWTYFASTDAEREELREVLDFLREEAPSLDDMVAELKRRGGLLDALAEWVSAELKSLPRTLAHAVIGAIATQLIFGAGLSSDDLERILREHERQYRQEQTHAGEDSREQTGGESDRPHEGEGTERPGEPK